MRDSFAFNEGAHDQIVAVIGAGLAGSELAFQLAEAGLNVVLIDMRPHKKSAAHDSDRFAELVCSNSFRSNNPENAVGLIKEEMRALGSLIMAAAREAAVPAGDALAVDRDRFSEHVTARIRNHPRIETIVREVVGFEADPNGVRVFFAEDVDKSVVYKSVAYKSVAYKSVAYKSPLPPFFKGGEKQSSQDDNSEPWSYANAHVFSRVVCATGPLTSEPLYAFLQTFFSRESLYFYDSIAPILSTDSIDQTIVYAASRYGKGESEADRAAYLNCPLTKDEYTQFIDALLAAEKTPIHEIDKPIFFEACLPIEVMAERGRDTLRFGPMKPVGLDDPKTGRWPYAVVQLRLENKEGTCYNMVGFQTRLKHGEQKRVFSMIPGLENAEFLRFGAMHRNSYLNSPELLTDQLACPSIPGLHFAGQITGVEGYVESAALGLLLGRLLPKWMTGESPPFPPKSTALGALYHHLRDRGESGRSYQPNNVHFGLFAALQEKVHKSARKSALVLRAREDFSEWMTLIK